MKDMMTGCGMQWQCEEYGYALQLKQSTAKATSPTTTSATKLLQTAKQGLAGVSVKQVSTDADMDAFVQVLGAANEYPAGKAAMLHNVYSAWTSAAAAATHWGSLVHYVAVHSSDGTQAKPVATCTILLPPPASASASSTSRSKHHHFGVYDIATIPSHRRRGLGALMTAVAVQSGIKAVPDAQWAVLQATAAGAGLYKRLGFTDTGARFECYNLAADAA